MAHLLSRLHDLLDRELTKDQKSLLTTIEFESRKDKLVMRMPIGVILLDDLWNRISQLCTESNIPIIKAPVYANAEELDDVLENVQWLWHNWIPKGFVTLLAGDPGIGKTMIAVDLARMIAGGNEFPTNNMEGVVQKPQDVIWIDAEAGHQILRERLIALKVNRRRIHLPVIDGDILGQVDFENQSHKDYLVNMIDEIKPVLVVLDSLGGSNRRGENKVEEIRPLMEFLAMLSRDKQIGTLVLHHLNKGSPGESTEVSLYRIRGSTAIPAYCRSIIAVEQGTGEDVKKIRTIKSNLARLQNALSITSEMDANGNVVSMNYSAYKEPDKKRSKRELCSDWIVDFIRASEDPVVPLKRITDSGELLGYNRNTVYAAKNLLGDRITVTGTGREVFWSLTNEIDHASIEALTSAFLAKAQNSAPKEEAQ